MPENNGNPQLEDGYVRIANELYEALARIRIPGEARQVLDVIIRKTYGFNKKADWISFSQFMQATGLSKSHIQRALSRLLDMNIVTKKGSLYTPTYGLQKSYGSWKVYPKKGTGTPKRGRSVPKLGVDGYPKRGNTKDTLTKDNSTKDNKKRRLRKSSKKREHEDQEFRLWFESEAGQEYVGKVGWVLGWTIEGMLAASRHAELWLADPDNPSRSKWGAFFRNWLENNKRFERERQEKRRRMTTEEEQLHYESKGGGQRSSDPESAADILERMKK